MWIIMKKTLVSIVLFLLFFNVSSQDCTIISKANDILPNGICSPVGVTWNVKYRGVNNAGTSVEIRYNWDDGFIETINAINIGAGEWEATNTHTYASIGDKCNYRPKATLVINGIVCTSSTQEQIVTVWDNDNTNGGVLRIFRTIHPICFGNGDNVRFRDNSRFNCVPPQERDVPNLGTRWIQWIYGTDITMTGIPVTINGASQTFPYYGDIITLPAPVSGSGLLSELINVADDKLIGQYFQVTLRNWNYCNPYDDPNIPGTPIDPINGDHPPVITTAIILIVKNPDATITPIDTLCINNDPILLNAVDGGGVWSGNGIVGNRFNPALANIGTHLIKYNITDVNGCSDFDSTYITVVPAPSVIIFPVDDLFINDAPIQLENNNPGGIWFGNGINIDGIFNPSLAGVGSHLITYNTLSDKYGCFGIGTTTINVILPPPPTAIFLPDTVGCAPLTVQFYNKSIMAESYLWDFGNRIFSNEKNPTHTYYVAGEYIVKLTAYNISGQNTTTGKIIVYQNPIPNFEIYPKEIDIRGKNVIFLNNSQFADFYFWDFGDGNFSIEESPSHKYEQEGYFDIKLITTTNDGCVDSLIKPNEISVFFIDGNIRYPNAFRWNRTAPTGGWWIEGTIDNTIFRPYFENVAKYEMLIYNRWGELIYSTKNIYQGWDGYLKDGSLAPESVYVYKVWVTYENGLSDIIVGDVTFLH